MRGMERWGVYVMLDAQLHGLQIYIYFFKWRLEWHGELVRGAAIVLIY